MADLTVVLSLVAAVLAIPRGLRLAFGEAADARRELKRHPLQRIACLQTGPVHITGRVVACAAPVVAPLSRRTCVAHVTTVSVGSSASTQTRVVRHPTVEQRFLLDDGSGRALVIVPPPPPEPLPGDDYDYEVLISLAGSLREGTGVFRDSLAVRRLLREWKVDPTILEPAAITEGTLQPGDRIAVGGYASLAIDPTGEPTPDATPYRGSPSRFMVTATRYYPLLIVKR
jgi:hypothetical protein